MSDTLLADAMSHLRVALAQTIPSDDAIIVDHMRDALAILERLQRLERKGGNR